MNQKPTYKIFNFFPEYSLEKWDDVYKSWVETYILTPKEQRNGSMWTGFVENVNTLKSFLKSHGRKFI